MFMSDTSVGRIADSDSDESDTPLAEVLGDAITVTLSPERPPHSTPAASQYRQTSRIGERLNFKRREHGDLNTSTV